VPGHAHCCSDKDVCRQLDSRWFPLVSMLIGHSPWVDHVLIKNREGTDHSGVLRGMIVWGGMRGRAAGGVVAA